MSKNNYPVPYQHHHQYPQKHQKNVPRNQYHSQPLTAPNINLNDEYIVKGACNAGRDGTRGFVGVQNVEICIQKANGDRLRVRKQFNYSNGPKGTQKFVNRTNEELCSLW